MNLYNNARFDFITGNLPWDNEIDKEFLIKCKNDLLLPAGSLALITSGSWLRGLAGKNKKLRSELIRSGNIKKIATYPAEVFINPNTQKPIKTIGSYVFYTNNEIQSDIELIRYFGDTTFTTTSPLDENNGIMLYLGIEGKELWDICTKNCKKIPLIKYVPSDKPKIHFNSKLDLNYFGSSKPLKTITGRKLLTGVQLDLIGSNNWIPKLKINSNRTINDNAAKRYMLEFDYNQENMAQNAYYHFSMRVFGLLLGMTSTISHVNKHSLGEMAYDILSGEYNNLEEYENAYYKSKNLTVKMINWIKTVGSKHGAVENLKDNDNIVKISRTVDRVKKTGELFTPIKYINDIIADLTNAGMCKDNKRILEPSCGDGNFVLAIIKKKIDENMSIINALRTTYAIDLMEDNINLCRKRVLDLVTDTYEHRKLVEHNIVCADTITGWDFDNWQPKLTQEENNNLLLSNF